MLFDSRRRGRIDVKRTMKRVGLDASWRFVRTVVGNASVVVLVLSVGIDFLEAQEVTLDCAEEECHVVPWARGHGGFVGRARNASEEVKVVLVCRGSSTTKVASRDLVPGSGGLVTHLFGIDDGSRDALLCEPNEDATLTIRGLADGGWYWIHDEADSAVAPLLSRDVLDNRRVRPVNPDSRDISIESNQAGTASFMKQFSTGRIAILSHILPEPEVEEVPCGPVADGELADGSPRYVARETGCTMGDGGTFLGMHTYGAAGVRVPVRGGQVFRPTSGVLRVGVSLWLNRTGSVVYGDQEDFPPTFGWPGIEGARSLVAEWEVRLVSSGLQVPLEDAAIETGERDETSGDLHIVVAPSESYCPEVGTQHEARVRVRAVTTTDASNRDQPYNPVRPRIRHSADLDGAAAEAVLDVVCPPRGARTGADGGTKGRELAFQSSVDGP